MGLAFSLQAQNTNRTWLPFKPENQASNRAILITAQTTARGINCTLSIDGGFISEINVNNQAFHLLTIPDCAYSTPVGHPQLPELIKMIAIPACCSLEDINIRITDSGYSILKPHKICPVPTISKKQTGSFYTKNHTSYNTDTFYPDKFVSINKVGFIRDQKVAWVEIFPVQYNPLTEELKTYYSLKFNINFPDVSKVESKNIGIIEQFKNQLFLNTTAYVSHKSNRIGEVTYPQNLFDTNSADYLIITANIFYQNENLAQLANFRAEFDSLDVAIVQTETIYQQFPAEKKHISIKDFLTYVYDNWAAPHVGDSHLSNVLIVGEGAQNSPTYIPTYFYSFLLDSLASDFWYTCINDDNEDGRIDKWDNVADLIIGRLSVENNSELNAVIKKTILHDNQLMLKEDWQKKICLISMFTDYDEKFFYLEDLYEQINDYVDHQDYYEISEQLRRTQVDPAIIRGSFFNAFNDGRGIISINAHGAIDQLADGIGSFLFTLEDTLLLNNSPFFPIVFNFSCNTGNFIDLKKDCLGEILLNQQSRGAVAFWGATTESRSPQYFNDAIFQSLMKYGDISLGTHFFLARLLSPPEKFFNLLGDPALNIKTKALHNLPNLKITQEDINFIWAIHEDQMETIEIAVHNNGFDNAKNVCFQIFNNDPQLGGKQLFPDQFMQEIEFLDGKQKVKFLIDDVTQQYFSVYVKVDPYNNITEFDELDNNAFAFFQNSYFIDVSGSGDLEHGLLPILADYNNDGYLDIFIANSNNNSLLFENVGRDYFADITKNVFISLPSNNLRNAIAIDLDNNFYLDIFLENSESAIMLNQGHHEFINSPVTIGLDTVFNSSVLGFFDYNNDGFVDVLSSKLLRNNSNGTFKDVTKPAGLEAAENGAQAAFGDYDNDGDFDLFLICSSKSPCILFQNNGDSSFTDVTVSAGLGNMNNGKYAAFADYDNDGDLDLLVTRLFFKQALFYRNNGDKTFTEVTESTGLNIPGGAKVLFFDYDNDGFLDLYVRINKGIGSIFKNNGAGRFNEDSLAFNKHLLQEFSGIAFGDIDNDGDIDLCATTDHSSQKSVLLSNCHKKNNWLTIKVLGSKSNSFGIGARVKAVVGNSIQIREVNCIFADKLQMSYPIHFGLGQYNRIDTLIVRWPSGIVDRLTMVDVNSILTIKEGYGDISIPNTSHLLQNYPNPFNSNTIISYGVVGDPHFGRSIKHVQLKIFNILGQEIKTLVDKPQESNFYSVHWDGISNRGNFAVSGVYIVRLQIEDQIVTNKLLLVR